jgi:pSer/pThr/pTyr-binding forkhead associated (FHA) protein
MPWLSEGSLTHELHDGEVIVGSGSEATWRVASADLMPRHFVLTVHGLNASVRPLSIDNVVVVNGRQLSGSPWTLHDGDVIAAGSGRFVFTDEPPRSAPARGSGAVPPAEAYLVDEQRSVAYRLISRSTGIGRDHSNAVVVRDPTASRFHAEVRREAGGFVLHARGSAGTRVNDRRVASPCMLEEGDRIEISYTVFRFTTQPPAPEQLAAGRSSSEDSDQRRSTPITDRMTIEAGIVPPPPSARERWRTLIAIVVVVAIALWIWLR